MEALKIRRLPVINKSKRMIGILSLGDVSHSASGKDTRRGKQVGDQTSSCVSM
jgi:CBS-domain-containing membrane protein